MKKLINIILWPYYWYVDRRAFKKRLAEMKARDPFIYK
jgi:hypothetical protein